MARDEDSGEESILNNLVCFATEQPIPVKDANAHGVLFVFLAKENTPYAAAVLSAGIHGTPAAVVNGNIVKDAKTIRLTLTRDNPDDDFRGWQYQCVESFK